MANGSTVLPILSKLPPQNPLLIIFQVHQKASSSPSLEFGSLSEQDRVAVDVNRNYRNSQEGSLSNESSLISLKIWETLANKPARARARSSH